MVTKNRNFYVRIISSFFLFLLFFFVTFCSEIYFLIFIQIFIFLLNWESLRMLEYKKLSSNTLKNNNILLTRCKVSKYDFVLILLINVLILFYSLSFQYLQILTLLAMIIYVYKIKVMNIYKLLIQ